MGPDNLSHRRSPSDVIGISREYAVLYKPYHLAVVLLFPKHMNSNGSEVLLSTILSLLIIPRLNGYSKVLMHRVILSASYTIFYRSISLHAVETFCLSP